MSTLNNATRAAIDALIADTRTDAFDAPRGYCLRRVGSPIAGQVIQHDRDRGTLVQWPSGRQEWLSWSENVVVVEA